MRGSQQRCVHKESTPFPGSVLDLFTLCSHSHKCAPLRGGGLFSPQTESKAVGYTHRSRVGGSSGSHAVPPSELCARGNPTRVQATLLRSFVAGGCCGAERATRTIYCVNKHIYACPTLFTSANSFASNSCHAAPRPAPCMPHITAHKCTQPRRWNTQRARVNPRQGVIHP